MDFFVKGRLSQGELECLQSDEFYPPRFRVYIASLQENAIFSGGKIAFRGATTDIEFDIHLTPDPLTSPATPPGMSVFITVIGFKNTVCMCIFSNTRSQKK